MPAAITGTSPLWRGALPKLKRVQIAFLPTVIPQASSAQGEIEEVIDERVWPAVQEEYGRLRASPGMIAAGLGALGLGGGLLATRRRERRRQVTVLGVVKARTLRRRKRRGRLLSRFRPLR